MKKNIGSKLALYPMPIMVIGAMNGDKPTWTLVGLGIRRFLLYLLFIMVFSFAVMVFSFAVGIIVNIIV